MLNGADILLKFCEPICNLSDSKWEKINPQFYISNKFVREYASYETML